MSSYLMISKESCPYCVKAKRLLKLHDIPYDEINVPEHLSRDDFRAIFTEMNSALTVPRIFVNNDLIGGYDDLVQYISERGKR